MFVGRHSESAALERLLAGVRSGRSGVMVLRGEPGVGKTALLEHLVETASGFRILRVVGHESEIDLPFAALEHLCAPLLPRTGALPAPQREALTAAFGRGDGTVPSRFLVGLAVLSLLSAEAGEQPLLCIVDDAQWLDQASAQALAFVGRRLQTDPVVLVFATRTPSELFAGLPELVIAGLDHNAARELLAATVPGRLDDHVSDRIVGEFGGNPLALLELPRGRTLAELGVGLSAPAGMSLLGRIEESFRRRVRQLPPDTQQLLLVAAADQLGEASKVWRAAQLLGVGFDAAGPAAAADLLEIDTRVDFKHPLVRSAVYRSAAPLDRRAAHRALAEASDPVLDPDRRAWHRAAAIVGQDEDVAADLERSAGRAQVRGGVAAAGAVLELAADLTPDPTRQAMRRVLAAGSYLAAGAAEPAEKLLERSVPHLDDPLTRAQAIRMEGALRLLGGRVAEAPALLTRAAKALLDFDVHVARETLLEALEAASWAGPLGPGPSTVDIATAAAGFHVPAGEETTADLLLEGYTQFYTNGFAAAVEPWRRGIAAFLDDPRTELRRWYSMLWDTSGALLEYDVHRAVAEKRVRLARASGALGALPSALTALGWCELLGSRADAAEALFSESAEIIAATGEPTQAVNEEITAIALQGWRGSDREARALAAECSSREAALGHGGAVAVVEFLLMRIDISLGRYEDARPHALYVFDNAVLSFGTFALGDIVEVLLGVGDRPGAEAALARLGERASASGAAWGLGLWARSRALLAPDAEAEALYREALEHLSHSGAVTELARAHLLYGEWLRRQRRRREARTELRQAHDIFRAAGGEKYVQRASAALLSTGERSRVRTDQTPGGDLTPQERQIALRAADGESNAEIAAALFISPHTVAYHLRKVFVKLGITSRNQLTAAIDSDAEAEALNT